MPLPMFGPMILGPPVPAGSPSSVAEITYVINSITGGDSSQLVIQYQTINPTGGVSNLSAMNTTHQTLAAGTLLKGIPVIFGPLTGPTTVDLTISVDDGFAVVHTYPVLLTGSAVGSFLTTEAAELLPVWTPDPAATFFFGWDATTAFPSPWSLNSISITGGDPGDSGTIVVNGIAGPAELEFTLDGSGSQVLPVSPAIQVDADSTYDIQSSSAELLSVAGTLTGHGEIPALDIPRDGVPAGDGTDPVIILQRSNDGGKTWLAEQSASMGKIGDYRRLVKWGQGGRSNNRAYRVICSEPVDASIVAADLDAVPGT